MKDPRHRRHSISLLALFVLCIAFFAVQDEALADSKKNPVDVLKDGAPTLCQTVRAIEKLGRSKDPRAIAELLKHLDSKCDEVADAVESALRSLKAGPVLTKRLEDSSVSEDDKVLACHGLRTLHEKGAAKALIRVSKTGGPRLRAAAIFALGVIAPAEAEPALIAALSDTDADVRRYAASELANVPTSAAKQAIDARLAVETDVLVRSALEWTKRTLEAPGGSARQKRG